MLLYLPTQDAPLHTQTLVPLSLLNYVCAPLPTCYHKPILSPLPVPSMSMTLKIKFKRKGGWIRTFHNWPKPILCKFGYGHPSIRLYNTTARHRHKRHLSQHCIVWVTHHAHVALDLLKILHIKPFNHYTKRGIRTSRFWLLKRKGKESKYTHLKSKIF
jgi:hypothetical protein